MKPFLKWAGGKTRLVKQLSERMPKEYNTYFEPFVGAGALLFHTMPKKAVISDANKQLINIYRQLQKNPQNMALNVEQLFSKEPTKELFLERRKIFNSYISEDAFTQEAAALMIWIVKNCFGGKYSVNANGEFDNSVDPSYPKYVNVVSMVKDAGDYLKSNKIEIRDGDFYGACSGVGRGDFVYFDPPYVPIGKNGSAHSYTKEGFREKEHKRLEDLLKQLDTIGAKFMLSNHDTQFTRDLYSGFNIEPINVLRSITTKYNKATSSAPEVIVTNY